MRGLGDLPSLLLRRAVEGVSWPAPVLVEVVSVVAFLLIKVAPGPVNGMEQTTTGVAIPAEKQRTSNRYGKTEGDHRRRTSAPWAHLQPSYVHPCRFG